MSQIDLEINRNIRRVLVRHWIDIGRLAIHSTEGRVRIHGLLQPISGMTSDFDQKNVENIVNEIERTKEIKRIYYEFENWINTNGTWQKLEKTKDAALKSERVSSTFSIDHNDLSK